MNAAIFVKNVVDDFVLYLKENLNLDYENHKSFFFEAVDDYLLMGQWDVTVDIEDNTLPSIRIIQEDEFDQSMDNDEDRPSNEDAHYVSGYYLFILK